MKVFVMMGVILRFIAVSLLLQGISGVSFAQDIEGYDDMFSGAREMSRKRPRVIQPKITSFLDQEGAHERKKKSGQQLITSFFQKHSHSPKPQEDDVSHKRLKREGSAQQSIVNFFPIAKEIRNFSIGNATFRPCVLNAHDPALSVDLVYGDTQHVQMASDIIGTAKHYVNLFFYSENGSLYFSPKIFDSIRMASERGVMVRLFCNSPSEEQFANDTTYGPFRFLENFRYTQFDTHSKAIIADGSRIVIGSWNARKRSDQVTDLSFHLSGGAVEGVSRLYHSAAFAFQKLSAVPKEFSAGVEKLSADPRFKKEIKVPYPPFSEGKERSWSLLTTPHLHKDFLKSMMSTAQDRIIVYSPFMNASSLEKGFPLEDVNSFLESGRRMTIVCSHFGVQEGSKRTQSALDILKSHFKGVSSHPNLALLERPNRHEKLLIVDDSVVAVGSFNWGCGYFGLSPDNTSNRFNTTLVIKGEDAKSMVQHLESLFLDEDLKKRGP